MLDIQMDNLLEGQLELKTAIPLGFGMVFWYLVLYSGKRLVSTKLLVTGL